MLGQFGQLTPDSGEKEVAKSVSTFVSAVNSLPVIWAKTTDKEKIDNSIKDMLASAATYLSDKRRNVIVAEIILLQQTWENLQKSKETNLKIRTTLLPKASTIQNQLSMPQDKLPEVPNELKAAVTDILVKADSVKMKEASKSLTPQEAKEMKEKSKKTTMLLGGGLLAAALAALFLRRR